MGVLRGKPSNHKAVFPVDKLSSTEPAVLERPASSAADQASWERDLLAIVPRTLAEAGTRFFNRPNIVFAGLFLSQNLMVSTELIISLNSVLSYPQIQSNSALYVRPLDFSTLCIVAFSDGSYANNSDNISQLGYLMVVRCSLSLSTSISVVHSYR
jgi:hypothetical protein